MKKLIALIMIVGMNFAYALEPMQFKNFPPTTMDVAAFGARCSAFYWSMLKSKYARQDNEAMMKNLSVELNQVSANAFYAILKYNKGPEASYKDANDSAIVAFKYMVASYRKDITEWTPLAESDLQFCNGFVTYVRH